MVPGLEALGAWCRSKKLFRAEDQTAEAILEIDANHAGARKTLRYQRTKTGTWRRKGRHRPRKDRNKEALADLPDARRRHLGGVPERLWRLLRTYDTVLPPHERTRTLRLLVALDPEHRSYREAHGEVEREGRWILAETWRRKRRTGQLRLLQARARKLAPETRDEGPTETEKALGVPFTHGVSTDDVRAVTTGAAKQAVEVVVACHRAQHIFARVFETDVTMAGFVVYVLTREGETDKLIDGLSIPDAEKAFLRRLGGFWLPDRSELAVGPVEKARRLDGVVRQGLNVLVRRAFGRVYDQAALNQGLGLYLGYLTTGTRLTIFARKTRYAQGDLGAAELAAARNWVAVARGLLASDQLPDLVTIMGTPLSGLTREDLVGAHAFTAYLLEGRAHEARRFYEEVDRLGNVNAASMAVLGGDLKDLDHRLRRWLRETGPTPR